MNFKEWWAEEGLHFANYETIEDIAKRAWEEGKEQAKPLAKIKYVDYPCDGYRKNGGAFWTVSNTSATVIYDTKPEVELWALNSGYRLK